MWKQHLQPYAGESLSDTEPFDEWHARVAQAMPGIPRELAEHWLYDNWGALERNVDYLSLADITATRGTLPLAQALEITVQSDWGAIEPGTEYLDGAVEAEVSLAVTMSQLGTWPVPIVVLDNDRGAAAPGRSEIGRWHLLEGHTRLTLLHGLAAAHRALPAHEVWLVRAGASRPATPAGPASPPRAPARVHDVRLKFDEAVERLAVGAGTVQQRLLGVFLGTGLSRIRADDLRGRHEVWDEMLGALRRVQGEQGSIVASIRVMGDREACHRARLIVELSRWLGEQDDAARRR